MFVTLLFAGVESACVDSAGDKKLIIVTGDDMDAIALVRTLRKMFPTELVSVEPVNEKQKMKAEVKKDSQEITYEPINGPGVGNDIVGKFILSIMGYDAL